MTDTPSPSVQPVRAWAVVDKDGEIDLVLLHFASHPSIFDHATPRRAPHRVEEVVIAPAATFDALKAARARAEAAEAEVKRLRDELLRWQELCGDNYYRAQDAERQRDEAFAAGAEAMREAAAVVAWTTGMDLHMKKSDAREIGSACAEAIRALPIPTQEVK